MRERFYRPTSENLSGKKKILKVGPLAAEITLMQKSTEKHVSGIGLRGVKWMNFVRIFVKRGLWKRLSLISRLSKPLFPPSRLCVHMCVRPYVRHKIFFSLKSPWNHPLTPGTPGARSPSGGASMIHYFWIAKLYSLFKTVSRIFYFIGPLRLLIELGMDKPILNCPLAMKFG